jgi:hypothetical protein
MAKQEYTNYQLGIINRYYNELDTISLAKIQELVSELYLTESEKKRAKLWERVHQAMVRLKIPSPIVDHIMAQKSVEILAKNLQEWLGGAHKERK